MVTITVDMLADVDSKTLRALENIPAYKDVVLEFKQSQKQVVIDYSNQEVFDFLGSQVSLSVIEMIAYSSLGGKKDDNEQTPHGEAKRAAWDILFKVKEGKKAQGVEYHLTPDGFRARVA